MRLSITHVLIPGLIVSLVAALPAQAASLLVSIGVRETGNPNNLLIGANGGSANGIEFINRDGQTLTADGTWQRFAFTPLTDPLTAFAGATANAVLDNDWGTLEHIRLGNVADGATRFRVWIDDIDNTTSTGPVNFANFEAAALGTESVFQEPGFSGSTSANLKATPNTSLVTNAMAHSGMQSTQVDFDFIDDSPVTGTPSRWVRLTTSNTGNTPNPLVRLRESVAGGPALPTTISFWAKAIVVPEPASILLAAFAALALAATSRPRPHSIALDSSPTWAGQK
jgi:hypothetical protein